MVWNEHRRSEALEQFQSILVRQVPFAKTRLPPRGIADRQERQIELPPMLPQRPFDQMMRVVDEGRVARKKRRRRRLEQVHVRGAPPSIEAVPIAFVCCRRRMQRDTAESHRFARRHRNGGFEPEPAKPFRHRRRRDQRNVARQTSE